MSSEPVKSTRFTLPEKPLTLLTVTVTFATDPWDTLIADLVVGASVKSGRVELP